MSRLLKSFPELPLKLLAVGTVADRNVSLQFPAGIPQAAFPGAAIPLGPPWTVPALLLRKLEDGITAASTNDHQTATPNREPQFEARGTLKPPGYQRCTPARCSRHWLLEKIYPAPCHAPESYFSSPFASLALTLCCRDGATAKSRNHIPAAPDVANHKARLSYDATQEH